MKSRITGDDLFADVVVYLFRFLSSSQLVECGQVCKRWYEWSRRPEVWESRTFLAPNRTDITDSVIQWLQDTRIPSVDLVHPMWVSTVTPLISSHLKQLAIEIRWLPQITTLDPMLSMKMNSCGGGFPLLESFYCDSSFAKSIAANWLQMMPILKELEIVSSQGQPLPFGDLKDHLMTKQLEVLKVGIVTPEELIHLFKTQPLRSLSYLTIATSINVWEEIMNIEGVAERLQEVNSSPSWRSPFDKSQHTIRTVPPCDKYNIKSLETSETTVHGILLYGAQESLTQLNLTFYLENTLSVDMSRIRLPNLRKIGVFTASSEIVSQLLSACGPSLTEISLSMDFEITTATTEYTFDFPNLTDLYVTGACMKIVEGIMKKSKGSLLEYLNINFDGDDDDGVVLPDTNSAFWKRNFCNVQKLNRLQCPESLFLNLAEYCNIESIEDLGLSSQNVLTESTLAKITLCKSLTSLQTSWTSVETQSAYSWLHKLISNCPRMNCIDIASLECHEPTITTTTQNTTITPIFDGPNPVEILNVTASYLVGSTPSILFMFSNLTDLSVYHISRNIIPLLFTTIEKYSPPTLNCVDFDFKSNTLGTDGPFTQNCSYLNKRLKSVGLGFADSFDLIGRYDLEDFMLVSLCCAFESNDVTFVQIHLEEEKVSEEDAYDLCLQILPDVVNRIDGISEEKRQQIVSEITTKSSLINYWLQQMNQCRVPPHRLKRKRVTTMEEMEEQQQQKRQKVDF